MKKTFIHRLGAPALFPLFLVRPRISAAVVRSVWTGAAMCAFGIAAHAGVTGLESYYNLPLTQWNGWGQHDGDIEIRSDGNAGPTPIVMKTCSWDAGAICSIQWNGKEFVDDFDKGRQLQTALFFGPWNTPEGAYYNPTEAGASQEFDHRNHDAYNSAYPNPGSSSILQGWTVGTNNFQMQSRMAWWQLGGPVAVGQPSPYQLNKSVTIGYAGLPHVIEYATSIAMLNGAAWRSGSFEVAAAYLHFNNINNGVYKRFNPTTYQLEDDKPPTATEPGNGNYPLIAADDNDHAIGLYAPPTMNPIARQHGETKLQYFGAFDVTQIGMVKLNHVVILSNASECAPVTGPSSVSGNYDFRTYVVVGSLENVRISMIQLQQVFNADFHQALDPTNYTHPVCQ